MKPVKRWETGYFLPDDWILWQSDGLLKAIKLSTGDQLKLEGMSEIERLTSELSGSVWDLLARFEPLVGQLRGRLQEQALQPLTRGTVLRGSGWRQLFVELTAKCNEQCVHCYAESTPTRTEALEWPEIRAVLEDAKTLGFGLVQLTGGDPLISPHCIRAVEYAAEIGIPQVEIYTNGLALRGKTYERLRELAPSFAFSLYSHDPKTHDAITQTAGSHERTTRAIRRAIEDGLKVRVGVISMAQNKDDAMRTQEYLLALGLAQGSIGFDQMRDVGRGDANATESHGPPLSLQSGGVETTRVRSFGGTAAVSYEGKVYPCIFSRHLPLGSIHRTSLTTILSSAEPVSARKRSLLSARARWGEKLSCWECQARSALLEGTGHA